VIHGAWMTAQTTGGDFELGEVDVPVAVGWWIAE
jgi:hypothetical protein